MPYRLEGVDFYHRDIFGRRVSEGIHDICLEVRPGSVICLTGANGSGKSTVIRLCLGFALPIRGNVTTPDCLAASYIGDGGRNLYPHLTIKENLAYISALRGRGLSSRCIEHALETAYDLKIGFDSIPVGNMSRGMRQKASIVCAIALPHNFLFADEPTLGLDELAQRVFEEMMIKERADGTGILLATNDTGMAYRICDEKLCLEKGTIAYREVRDVPFLA